MLTSASMNTNPNTRTGISMAFAYSSTIKRMRAPRIFIHTVNMNCRARFRTTEHVKNKERLTESRIRGLKECAPQKPKGVVTIEKKKPHRKSGKIAKYNEASYSEVSTKFPVERMEDGRVREK